jgi:hypothetical protein
LADEVRRTLAHIDEIDSHLQRAGAAIEKAQALTAKHRARLAALGDSAAAIGMTRGTRTGRASAGNGKATSQAIKSTDLKSGKVTNISGGKPLP